MEGATKETEVRMDGVKVALGNRGMTVEAARQCAKYRKEWDPGTYITECIHAAIFAWLCSFVPPSRVLVVILWSGEGCRYMMR